MRRRSVIDQDNDGIREECLECAQIVAMVKLSLADVGVLLAITLADVATVMSNS